MKNSIKIPTNFIFLGVILLFLYIMMFYGFLSTTEHNQPKIKNTHPQDTPKYTHNSHRSLSSTPDPEYHEEVSLTKSTDSFTTMNKPACWNKGCSIPSNTYAMRQCGNDKATEWNRAGVKYVERWMTGIPDDLDTFYSTEQLESAVHAFEMALQEDNCEAAMMNLALVEIRRGNLDKAISLLKKIGGKEARALIYLGMAYEHKGDRDAAIQAYTDAIDVDSKVEQEYHGIILGVRSYRGRMTEYNNELEREANLDYLLWKEFSEEGFVNWAILFPQAQDFFIENKYIVLKRVVAPYPLRAMQKCFGTLIRSGRLSLGDPQSRRYHASNARCISFIHFTYTDLLRKVIHHEAQPSYTYFGGYVAGAELAPHNDRFQCEWTFSLSVENYPSNWSWTLSADKKPLFERDDERQGHIVDKLPPEERIVDADLYAGDALIFMGRHLIHFRRGALEEGHWINQVFLHYVPSYFTKGLN